MNNAVLAQKAGPTYHFSEKSCSAGESEGCRVSCDDLESQSQFSLRRPHDLTDELATIPVESIERSILLIRGQKVILDRTLAKLYGVSTKALNQAVKRNPQRFPPDFMFQLTMEEAKAEGSTQGSVLRSQIVTLRSPHGKHTKYRPYAFSEHGILMLSSVLNSERAVQVNIEIMHSRNRLAFDQKISRSDGSAFKVTI